MQLMTQREKSVKTMLQNKSERSAHVTLLLLQHTPHVAFSLCVLVRCLQSMQHHCRNERLVKRDQTNNKQTQSCALLLDYDEGVGGIRITFSVHHRGCQQA
mmetsp:Transcript_8095/g.13074  ORF Transcript_8095/g.13074 Transcript_8095/m.13074 type:complete len:101 (-) Transcript_8095:2133-2435(-)